MEEMFRIALRNLSYRKSRTLLTLLGVMIGIASVVALISLGDGLNRSVEEQLGQLGPNRIIIAQRTQGGFGPPIGGITLSERDMKEIEKINGVEVAIPMLMRSLPIRFGEESVVMQVMGFPSEETEEFFSDVQSFEIAQGRYLKEGEKSAVVIGDRIHRDVFRSEIRLRNKIRISGKTVQVVGILEPTGNADNDNAIFMSIEALRDITGVDDEITFIMAKARDNPKEVAVRIEEELEDLHNEKLFIALTSEQLIEQIGSVFGIISLVLAGIAGISLLVASFGIMNTMLMAVLERTREIGTMKAVGATNKAIITLFLTESAIVGFAGGIIGMVMGYAFAFSFAEIGINFMGITIAIGVDAMLVAFVIGFSTMIGILSGTYPAYRAARLNPIEALRYE